MANQVFPLKRESTLSGEDATWADSGQGGIRSRFLQEGGPKQERSTINRMCSLLTSMWYRLCHTSSHAKKVSANRPSTRKETVSLASTLRGGKVGNTGQLSWPRTRWGVDRFSRRDQEQLVETRIPQFEQWGIGSQPESTARRVKLSVLFLVTLRCDVGIMFHCWSVRLCHACSYWTEWDYPLAFYSSTSVGNKYTVRVLTPVVTVFLQTALA